MDTLAVITDLLKLDLTQRSPIEIPNFGRDNLALLFCRLGFTKGVEVGVEQGIYTEILCQANPNAEIHGVDPWLVYPEYREHISQENIDVLYLKAKTRLQQFPNCILWRGFSSEVVKEFKDNSLDFVYIDANHTLQFVIQDIAEWSRKIRKGGIIAGHDYRLNKPDPYRNHTVQAVQAWTNAYHINPWFILGTKAIREGEVRDRPRSWMWVKA